MRVNGEDPVLDHLAVLELDPVDARVLDPPLLTGRVRHPADEQP
jgi:hypothetical protein